MKKRIIGATLITVVCALLISNLVGVLLFRSREMDAARNTLQELLVLMDAQSAITDPDGLAQQFHAAAPDKRLTIIDTDGTVLADTEANPQTLEDHNSRPEVEQAAATGWGEAVRHSETLGTSMLYVSKRFADGMVGRASMPLSSIDSLVWNGVWGFLIASAAGLLLALILARRTANRVVAPLSAVGSALQSVLDGTRASGLEDYQADDELRPILRYIDKLMERLGGYIQSITAERDKVGLILDCMDEGLILLDEAGNVLAINRAARTLFGRGHVHPHLRCHRAQEGRGHPQRVHRQRLPRAQDPPHLHQGLHRHAGLRHGGLSRGSEALHHHDRRGGGPAHRPHQRHSQAL